MSLNKSPFFALLSLVTLAITSGLHACPGKIVNKSDASISVVAMRNEDQPSWATDIQPNNSISFGSGDVKANFFIIWPNGNTQHVVQTACTGQMDENGEMAEVLVTVTADEVLVPDFSGNKDNTIDVNKSRFFVSHTFNAYEVDHYKSNDSDTDDNEDSDDDNNDDGE